MNGPRRARPGNDEPLRTHERIAARRPQAPRTRFVPWWWFINNCFADL
ncbi:MAG: hypothetical protein ACF8PN_04490 [Phycisphaerales bacterium]